MFPFGETGLAEPRGSIWRGESGLAERTNARQGVPTDQTEPAKAEGQSAQLNWEAPLLIGLRSRGEGVAQRKSNADFARFCRPVPP